MAMKQRGLVTGLLVFAVGCSTGTDIDQCVEDLQRRQDQAAHRAIDEADGVADTIEGALDIQKESGLDEAQIRLLRKAQERARDMGADLDAAFSVGCQ